MLIRYLIAVFLCCGIAGLLSAQHGSVDSYRQAREELRVLKQTGEIFPFSGLDQLRIGVINIGTTALPVFADYLKKYSPKVTILPVPNATGHSLVERWVEERQSEYDIFIIAFVEDTSRVPPPAYFFKRAFVQAVVGTGKAVSLIFDHRQALQKVPALNEAAAVVTAEYSFHGQSLAAQLLFGGVTVSDYATPIRLGYAPPEAVQMDGQLLRDSIRSIVEEGIEKGAFPGAQVLVAHKGKVVYHEAFGYHTYEGKQPVQTTDIYDFASVTKVTSALAAVMKLHGEGKFDLDTTLQTYFPEFRRGNKKDLVFRPMLAHQARLIPYITHWKGTLKGHARYPWRKWRQDPQRINDFRFRKNSFSTDSSAAFPIRITDDLWLHRDYKEQMFKAIRKSPLREEEQYVYSGLLFFLFPDIIEQLTGQDYEQYLKENFYHRLGAYTLTYNPLRYYPKDRIVPTERDTFFRMLQVHGTVHDEGAAMMDGVSANAGLFGSANDLAKLFQMYMNYGTYGGDEYIASATVQEFTRCQYCDRGNRRGLGFDKPLIEYDRASSSVAEAADPSSFGHSGYTGTFVWADPKADLLYIFFSNRVYPSRDRTGIYQLGIRPRIHSVLYEAID